MGYEQILYEVSDGILTITLNRPERLNAVTPTMIRELVDAIGRADADDDVRAIIVTGAGRAFCAGADLSRGGDTFAYEARDSRTGEVHRDGGGFVTLRIFECRKPVIAAINGPAVGFGVTMTLAMDLRLASEKARFGFVFARRGVVPEACSSWFLPRIVGIEQALDWAYSGRVFPATEALAGGLVRRLFSAEDLIPAARRKAQELVRNSSAVSVALIRQMMWKMLGADHPMEAHKVDSRGMQWTGRSADAGEGVVSFLEKRPAAFSGKVSRDLPDLSAWWPGRTFE